MTDSVKIRLNWNTVDSTLLRIIDLDTSYRDGGNRNGPSQIALIPASVLTRLSQQVDEIEMRNSRGVPITIIGSFKDYRYEPLSRIQTPTLLFLSENFSTTHFYAALLHNDAVSTFNINGIFGGLGPQIESMPLGSQYNQLSLNSSSRSTTSSSLVIVCMILLCVVLVCFTSYAQKLCMEGLGSVSF